MNSNILLNEIKNISNYQLLDKEKLYVTLIENRLNKCIETYYYDLNKSYERLQSQRKLYLLRRINNKERKKI